MVDDEESPNSGSNIHQEDYDDVVPTATSLAMDTEEPESPDQMHGSWAAGRATAEAEKKGGLE